MEISAGYTVGAYSVLVAIVASYVYLRVIKPAPVRQPVRVETKAEPKKKKAKKDVKEKADVKEVKKAPKEVKSPKEVIAKDTTKEVTPKETTSKDTPKETTSKDTPKNAAKEVKEEKKKDKKKDKKKNSKPVETKTKVDAPKIDATIDAHDDSDDSTDEATDDREFARQLSSLKQGTKFDRRATDSPANRHKSVKQSRAAKADFDSDEKASLSSAADASAEPTPDASPVLAPADSTGVADMLEPAPAGPSVLRLVDTEDADKPKSAPKPKEVKETKKQRQNRRKNEELKAAREAAEVERKQLEEAQRRTARIAEGRPARDGTQFMAAQQAWNNEAKSSITPSSSYELLDTADATPPVAAPVAAPAAKSASKIDDSWMSELPSEEEQMKMAKADAEWSTVQTRASKKTKKESDVVPAATTPEPAALPTPQPSVERPKPAKPTGSFAALSAPADEEEVEWDV